MWPFTQKNLPFLINFFTLFLRSVVRHRMLMKVVMAGKVCCHMLRLPVSTALKLRFGKSVAAQLLLLVINTTLLIAGAVQGGGSVLPALHTLTGSQPLFLSCFVSLSAYTQQAQRRGQFAPHEHWLLAWWFYVLYCKPEPRHNLCLSIQLQVVFLMGATLFGFWLFCCFFFL